MKVILIFLGCLAAHISVLSQNVIPEKISVDLVLKPQAKPYETKGFIVEKGATLTLMPGVKINFIPDNDPKNNCNMIIEGGIVIGAKGNAKSAPVSFTGVSPWIFFKSAKIEINGWEVTAVRYQFFGDNTGTIKNVNFFRNQKAIPYTFNLTVPDKGNLTISDCLIEDQGLDINTKNFPNDMENLSITRCAFTSRLNGKKLRKHFMPTTFFAYSTKCDTYLDFEFKAFDWVLKKPVANECFIGNENIRKTTEDSIKTLKNFSLKLPAKPFTNFKQEEVPPEKEEKK